MDPRYTCLLCGGVQVVHPDGRSDFPPAVAKKKLEKRCEAAGCTSQLVYTAGTR